MTKSSIQSWPNIKLLNFALTRDMWSVTALGEVVFIRDAPLAAGAQALSNPNTNQSQNLTELRFSSLLLFLHDCRSHQGVRFRLDGHLIVSLPNRVLHNIAITSPWPQRTVNYLNVTSCCGHRTQLCVLIKSLSSLRPPPFCWQWDGVFEMLQCFNGAFLSARIRNNPSNCIPFKQSCAIDCIDLW